MERLAATRKGEGSLMRVLMAIENIVGRDGGIVRLTWSELKMVTREIESTTGFHPHDHMESVTTIEEVPYGSGESGSAERARILALYLPEFYASKA
jgi:hypothetical protein